MYSCGAWVKIPFLVTCLLKKLTELENPFVLSSSSKLKICQGDTKVFSNFFNSFSRQGGGILNEDWGMDIF